MKVHIWKDNAAFFYLSNQCCKTKMKKENNHVKRTDNTRNCACRKDRNIYRNSNTKTEPTTETTHQKLQQQLQRQHHLGKNL